MIIGISVVTGALVIISTFFFYTLVLAANRTTSPGKMYQATYNRITNVITVSMVNSNMKWHFGECKAPAFLWSPDNRFLAMTASDTSGNRRIEILNTETSSSISVPTQIIDERYANVEAVEWLDNNNVLVDFVLPSGDLGQEKSGQFIFEPSSYTVKELNTSDLYYDQFGNPIATSLSLQEAQAYEPFGYLFPTAIIHGYADEYEISVFGDTILEARFYNGEDELLIKIAAKEFFGDIQTNTVFYLDNLTNGTYIYIDGSDYIVYYSFSASDINDVQGFIEMVNSAAFFHK